MIIAQVGYEKGIIGSDVLSVVLMVVVITTLIASLSLKRIFEWLPREYHR